MIILIILIGIIILGMVVAFVWKVGESSVALTKPAIECPKCGRKINVVGKTPRCYKCNTKLIKHANGNYIEG